MVVMSNLAFGHRCLKLGTRVFRGGVIVVIVVMAVFLAMPSFLRVSYSQSDRAYKYLFKKLL